RSRGAATAKDLQWWTGLTLTQVKRGIAVAEASKEIQPAEGPHTEAMWIPTYAADVTENEITAALEKSLLLPAFDEYLLSYTGRHHVMDIAQHHTTIGPGKNGLFKPFRLVNGEALPREI
ncbi:MAG: winged helix DNA-binding domain-containing protein, partial [Corynebacterium sp.]|nr:winged helix DNA-binding domain-containing protein [Corynebacterium sp.]